MHPRRARTTAELLRFRRSRHLTGAEHVGVRARASNFDGHSWDQRVSRECRRCDCGGRPADRCRRRRAAEPREICGRACRRGRFNSASIARASSSPKSITSPCRAIRWARLGTKLRFAIRMPKFALDRVRVMKRFAGIREDLASAFRDRARSDPRPVSSHRASHRASREHIFRFAIRAARRCFPPTASAISQARCGPSAKGRRCACSAKSLSRTRSGCITRRSRSTSASGNSATNTK